MDALLSEPLLERAGQGTPNRPNLIDDRIRSIVVVSAHLDLPVTRCRDEVQTELTWPRAWSTVFGVGIVAASQERR